MKLIAILFGLASGLCPIIGQATLITFSFTGEITFVAALDPGSPFPDPVEFATPFSGTYTFESTTPDAIADSSSGSYVSPTGEFTLLLGGLSFSFDGISLATFNIPGFDFYGVIHSENPSADNPTGVLLQISLPGLTDLALSSDALPLIFPSLSWFDTTNAFFFTDTIAGNQVEVGGALDTLVCTAGCRVPEPGTATLLASAALALFLRRRLRRA
jgi:hypothetical protein